MKTPLLLTLSLLTAAAAHASTFVFMSEEEMVSNAEAVVIGQVMGQRSFWNSQGNLIVTEATLSVQKSVQGMQGASPLDIPLKSSGIWNPEFRSQNGKLKAVS